VLGNSELILFPQQEPVVIVTKLKQSLLKLRCSICDIYSNMLPIKAILKNTDTLKILFFNGYLSEVDSWLESL